MNLVEGILNELKRCRDLIPQYDAIGPVGVFGKTMIQAAITEGEAALGDGDVIRALAAYETLKGCK